MQASAHRSGETEPIFDLRVQVKLVQNFNVGHLTRMDITWAFVLTETFGPALLNLAAVRKGALPSAGGQDLASAAFGHGIANFDVEALLLAAAHCPPKVVLR